MKRVLIFTTSSDSYNIAGRAIANGLATRYPSISFRLVDVYKGREQLDFQKVGRDMLTRALAQKLEKDRYAKEKYADDDNVARKLLAPYINSVRDYVQYNIKSFEPDLVICTHILPAVIVSDMEKAGELNKVRSAYIECNYTVNPYIKIANKMDYYICASKDLVKDFKRLGVKDSDRILDLGIPIISNIENVMPKDEARELLGLDKYNFTILITNYTGKIGKTIQLVKAISKKYDDVNIIVVSNKNIKLRDKIVAYSSKNKLKNIKVVTHTNNMGVLLSASDVVMGKTGGVEVACAIAKHLPYIVTHKIRGLELSNLKYLKNKKLVINTRTTVQAVDVMDNLKNDIKYRKKCVKAQESVYRLNATDEIVKFLYHKHSDIEG